MKESTAQAPRRGLSLRCLVKVLLIETLRLIPPERSPRPADPRLARALRQVHGDLAHDWTVPRLT